MLGTGKEPTAYRNTVRMLRTKIARVRSYHKELHLRGRGRGTHTADETLACALPAARFIMQKLQLCAVGLSEGNLGDEGENSVPACMRAELTSWLLQIEHAGLSERGVQGPGRGSSTEQQAKRAFT